METMKRVRRQRSCVSVRTRDKLAARLCVFPKAEMFDSNIEYTPVYLNVYDLTPANGYMYWAGFGIFHSGVEVHGSEYAFGAHDFSTSGVFEVEPRQCPGFKFRRSIFMGTTAMNADQVRQFMEEQSRSYHGNTYHLIVKNCNHFCDDICYKLTHKAIPKWVNRLARIGSSCNCLLPDGLRTTTNMVPNDSEPEESDQHQDNKHQSENPRHELDEDQEQEDQKRDFRNRRCFSTLSASREADMISSLLLQTQYSGSLLQTDLSTTAMLTRNNSAVTLEPIPTA